MVGCGIYITISNSTLTASTSSSMALKFLLCLIAVLGKFAPIIFNIAQVFPGTISQRRIYFQNISSVPTIVNMVVCRCCHSIFPFQDCIERKRSILIPRLCFNCLKSNVRMPLLREVITNQQKRKLYPFCVYPTCSLIAN